MPPQLPARRANPNTRHVDVPLSPPPPPASFSGQEITNLDLESIVNEEMRLEYDAGKYELLRCQVRGWQEPGFGGKKGKTRQKGGGDDLIEWREGDGMGCLRRCQAQPPFSDRGRPCPFHPCPPLPVAAGDMRGQSSAYCYHHPLEQGGQSGGHGRGNGHRYVAVTALEALPLSFPLGFSRVLSGLFPNSTLFQGPMLLLFFFPILALHGLCSKCLISTCSRRLPSPFSSSPSIFQLTFRSRGRGLRGRDQGVGHRENQGKRIRRKTDARR